MKLDLSVMDNVGEKGLEAFWTRTALSAELFEPLSIKGKPLSFPASDPKKFVQYVLHMIPGT